MKLYSIVSTLLLLALMACNSKTSESDQVKETSLDVLPGVQEVVQYLTPNQKSIHLFNLPEGVSEQQFVGSISDVNSAITEIGYPGVGYHLYKVESDTIQEYRYFMEGLWPNPETYKIIHENDKWKQTIEKHSEVFSDVMATQLYRRMLKVEMNE